MRVQRVLMPDGAVSWTVLGVGGEPVHAVEAFLAHLQALDRSPTTLRTYATSLKLWLQFLEPMGVAVDEASLENVSRFVAWLRAPAGNVAVLPGGSGRCCGDGEPAPGGAVLLLRLTGPQRCGARAVAGGLAAGQPGWLPAVLAPCHLRSRRGHPAVAAAPASPTAPHPDRRADTDAG